MMAGAIAYKNLFDDWTLDIDGGPGTDYQALAGFPVSNLQTRQLSRSTRITNLDTVNANALAIPFAAPAPVQANLIVVYGSIPGSINLEGTLDSGSVATFSTDNSGIGLPPISFYLIPVSYGDLVRFTLEYGFVFTPDYVELARIYVANALILPEGVDAQWSLVADDNGTLEASAGLQWYESPGVRTRRLDVTLSQMPTEVAFGFAEGATTANPAPCIQDMQLAAGATGEVVVIPRAGNSLWIRRASVYGHLDRVPSIRHVAGPNFSTAFTVIEER